MVFSSPSPLIEPVYDNGRGCIGGNRILGICRDSGIDLLASDGGSVSGGGGGGVFVLDNGGKFGGVAEMDGVGDGVGELLEVGEMDGVDRSDGGGEGDDSMVGMSGISISASKVSLG